MGKGSLGAAARAVKGGAGGAGGFGDNETMRSAVKGKGKSNKSSQGGDRRGSSKGGDRRGSSFEAAQTLSMLGS